jgi:hypothetical protein
MPSSWIGFDHRNIDRANVLPEKGMRTHLIAETETSRQYKKR